MSGDCDLCGSYDHVETGCDAYKEPVVGACASCGHDPACGFASVNGDWLCHDDDHSCYFQASIDSLGNGSDGYDEVRRRLSNDNGNRTSLSDVAAELGIDLGTLDEADGNGREVQP